MGESHRHFHAPMVPRRPHMPKDAGAGGVFDLQRAARAGELQVDVAQVAAAVDRYRAALRSAPSTRRGAVGAVLRPGRARGPGSAGRDFAGLSGCHK